MPITTKNSIIKHKRREHFQCKKCERYFKDAMNLDKHMIKMHKENNKKHDLEREPSLRNHKIKKTDISVGEIFEN